MKHAFLISAHGYYDQLKILVQYLDSEFGDIYIHINKNVEYPDANDIISTAKQSKVIFIDTRVAIEWGNNGLLKASFELLKYAKSKDCYDYYHFLSVQDLPIKPMNYIRDFFEKNKYNNASNGLMTNYVQCEKPIDVLYPRVCQYNFFISHWRDTNVISKCFYKGLNYVARRIQQLFCVDRTRGCGYVIHQGYSWWSIASDFADYFLKQESKVFNLFDKYSFAADEFAIQTVISNSRWKDSVFNSPIISSGLRRIDFSRGNGKGSPHIYTISDYRELQEAEELFARKFDLSIDSKIVERLNYKAV